MLRQNVLACFFGILLLVVSGVCAEVSTTAMNAQLTGIRYSLSTDQVMVGVLSGDLSDDFNDDDIDFHDGMADRPGTKSPTKAFLLSLAVPGAGQLYYGSKFRAAVFFGAEVATWALYLNWHADGTEMEDTFEAFNREHWSRDRYEAQYLYWAYAEYREQGKDYVDDEWVAEGEISHRLPDTRTQQYYEMTGKYDQFSWGWEDAALNDSTLDDYSESNPPPRITDKPLRPYSALRDQYEEMRNDANNSFDKANRMIIVGIVNRLISGFEAYFVTKGQQNRSTFGKTLDRVRIRADIRSYNSWRDTPYVNVAYRF